MSQSTALAEKTNLDQVIEQDKIDKLIQGEERIRKQHFTSLVNQDPRAMASLSGAIKEHPLNGTDYIPISIVEMMLDQIFFGEWQTKNYTTKQVLNEIVGDIELVVTHPVTGREITRTGSAAVPIQQREGAKPQEIEKKYTRALEKDYPHVKSSAIKNAAKSLGRIFGRDLGRKSDSVADDFEPMISKEREEKIHQSLNDIVDKNRNGASEQE